MAPSNLETEKHISPSVRPAEFLVISSAIGRLTTSELSSDSLSPEDLDAICSSSLPVLLVGNRKDESYKDHFEKRINTVVLIAKTISALPAETRQQSPLYNSASTASASWLLDALKGTIVKSRSRFLTNPRLSEDDMEQLLGDALFFKAIPTFNPSAGAFRPYFSKLGRLHLIDNLGYFSTHFRTPHRLQNPDDNVTLATAQNVGHFDHPHMVDGQIIDLKKVVSPTISNNPADIFTSNESFLNVMNAINSAELSDIERECYLGIVVDGVNPKDFSAKIGKKYRTVISALARAKKSIHAAFELHGIHAEDF